MDQCQSPDLQGCSSWLYQSATPPPPQTLDHRILKAGGTTTALNMKPSRLERAKLRRTSQEDRMLELVRENGAYRWEIGFFRACDESAKRFRAEVCDIAQQMKLAHLYAAYGAEQANNSIWEFSDALVNAVNGFDKSIQRQVQEWQQLWQIRREDTQATKV